MGRGININKIINCVAWSLLGLDTFFCFFLLHRYSVTTSPQKFFEKYNTSVVEIKCSSSSNVSTATATCIDDNLFITCAHCIGEYTLNGFTLLEGHQYKFFGETEYKIFEVVRYDLSIDIALLKIETNKEKKVNIDPNKENFIGEEVFALGNPLNQGISISRGIITGNNVLNEDGVVYVCSDNSTQVGCSGGGLFKKDGSLIGMITSKYDGYTYSLFNKEILKFLGED